MTDPRPGFLNRYGALVLVALFLVGAFLAGDQPAYGINDVHFFCLGLAFVVMTFDTLRTGRTWGRYSGIDRSRNPILYWIICVGCATLTVVLLAAAFLHHAS